MIDAVVTTENICGVVTNNKTWGQYTVERTFVTIVEKNGPQDCTKPCSYGVVPPVTPRGRG